MVYFIQPVGGGPIKIGQTGSFEMRIKHLEREFRCTFALLGEAPGHEREEAAMHARFTGLRIGFTEQFRPGPQLTEYLGIPAVPDWELVEAMPSIFQRSKTRHFRSIPKEAINAKIPVELHDEIRRREAYEIKSRSQVLTELLCLALGLDPAEFGIEPDQGVHAA